jgi:hypothetical protein
MDGLDVAEEFIEFTLGVGQVDKDFLGRAVSLRATWEGLADVLSFGKNLFANRSCTLSTKSSNLPSTTGWCISRVLNAREPRLTELNGPQDGHLQWRREQTMNRYRFCAFRVECLEKGEARLACDFACEYCVGEG